MTTPQDAALAEIARLNAQIDQLSKRVEDLRAFEREYRLRLLAFHEDQARALREGRQ